MSTPEQLSSIMYTQHTRYQKFLKGPIPWDWLAKAGNLPGHTLHVANVLWLLRGLNQSNSFQIEFKHLKEMGVSRQAMYRSLTYLKRENLITYVATRGKSTQVTLIIANSNNL